MTLKKFFLLLLISLITVLLLLAQQRPECYFCALIIIIYIIFYIEIIEIQKYVNSVCGFFVFFLTFVRYALIPLLIMFDDGYMSYKPLDIRANGDFFVSGALLTIWEMFLCGIYIYNRFPQWYFKRGTSAPLQLKTPSGIWVMLIFLFGSLIIVDTSILDNFAFVVGLKPDDSVFEEAVHLSLTETIATIGARVVKIILPIPLLCVLYKNFQRNHSFFSYLIGMIVLLFLYGFIIEGNSRNSIIIPAVASIFILFKLFPSYTKSTLLILLPSIAIVIVLSSVWKSFSGDYLIVSDKSFSYWISYVESYFAGISNMGKAVYSYQHTTDVFFNPSIAVNDMCQTIPFINVLFDANNTSVHYFHMAWGRTDQVIPATGNGLFYFSYVFAPCVSMVFIKLSHYFDKLKEKATSLPEFVVYCYSCCVVSYNIYNSVTTMMMKITITLVPLLFALYISKQVNRKKNVWFKNI